MSVFTCVGLCMTFVYIMFLCMYVGILGATGACMYARIRMHVFMYIICIVCTIHNACIYVYMQVCKHVCRKFACMYVCTCIICTCMLYAYTHIPCLYALRYIHAVGVMGF